MDTIIRILLIVVAVIAVVSLLSAIIQPIGEAVDNVVSAFGNILSQLLVYFKMGRSLLNSIVGLPYVIDFLLWSVILYPVLTHGVDFGIMLYKKFTD